MDVGSGTGCLAFFAIQAGAARVYCVEAIILCYIMLDGIILGYTILYYTNTHTILYYTMLY